MDHNLIPADGSAISTTISLPPLIHEAGPQAARRFVEFFAANIRNRGTREVYARSVARFCRWCGHRRVGLTRIEPLTVAAYIEQLTEELARPTVKLHLAAIRMLFDYLVTGQVMPLNPAASVRGPKHVTKKGKTPVLSAAETRLLLDSIDTGSIGGLRDRALIGLMVFSFARVSAALGMDVEDYYPQGRRMWFRFYEKGGKRHEVPAHHNAEAYLDAYIEAAGIAGERNTPLFRTLDRARRLTDRRMCRVDALRMVKRRCRQAGMPESTCCHTFRATGITAYLENGGRLDNDQPYYLPCRKLSSLGNHHFSASSLAKISA